MFTPSSAVSAPSSAPSPPSKLLPAGDDICDDMSMVESPEYDPVKDCWVYASSRARFNVSIHSPVAIAVPSGSGGGEGGASKTICFSL